MKIGVLQTAFIGDVALTGLLFEGLFRSGHEVCFFTNKAGAALFLNETRFSSIDVINKGKGLYKARKIFSAAHLIKKRGLDVILVPHPSMTSALVAKISGVKKRVGFSGGMRDFLFTQTYFFSIKVPRAVAFLGLAKEYLSSAELGSELSAKPWGYLHGQGLPTSFLSCFSQFAGENPAPYFAVFPGSVWATKKLPAELVAEFISAYLKMNKEIYCVLSGGPQDEEDARLVLQSISKSVQQRVIFALKEIPLSVLSSFLRRAQFAVTHDSGPMHIASGVNCPVVSLFGPTPWNTGMAPTSQRSAVISWRPLLPTDPPTLACQPCSPHGPKVCPLQHHKCMKEIQVSDILNAVEILNSP